MTTTPTSASPPRPLTPPGRRRRGPLGRFMLVIVLLAVAAGAAYLVVKASEPPAADSAGDGIEIPDLKVLPGTALAQGRPLPTEPDVVAWAKRASEVTDIPARTLVAYVNADLLTQRRDPDCKITWATLAGVGRVESHHGHFRGARVGEDGKLTKPIIGIPLDGSPGVRAIRDTDRGELDGDTQWDRAVGAMQFLPSTWTRWAARAGEDNTAPDPQDMDDAALTAARYLCASGGDLSTGDGWWKAVLTYNNSVEYGRDVYSGADAYARKVAELG